MQDLMALINHAFAETEYPGDDALTAYQEGSGAYDETWKLLRGRDWREMPVEEFITGDTPIPDLTPRAFHYYLPALLKSSLDSDLAGDHACDSLSFYLNPQNAVCESTGMKYDRRPEFEEFRSLLTPEQREAVVAVIDAWNVNGWLNWADADEHEQLRSAYI